MEIASLVELVLGSLTGLHGVGWLMRGRWKVGFVSLGLSVLVNMIFFFLIVPTAFFALIPQLSLQIGWALFSARALNDELRKSAAQAQAPHHAPHAPHAPYAQLAQPLHSPYPPYPPYPPYQQPLPQQRPQPAQQQPLAPQPAPPSQQPYAPYQPPIGYAQPAPPSQRPQQRQPLSPPPTPDPQNAPTLPN